MKHLISKLLEEIAQFELTLSIDLATEKVQAALDAGEFDCLVQHPADEPPDSDREVIVYYAIEGANLGYFHAEYDEWWVYALSGFRKVLRPVVAWCELPLVKRSGDV